MYFLWEWHQSQQHMHVSHLPSYHRAISANGSLRFIPDATPTLQHNTIMQQSSTHLQHLQHFNLNLNLNFNLVSTTHHPISIARSPLYQSVHTNLACNNFIASLKPNPRRQQQWLAGWGSHSCTSSSQTLHSGLLQRSPGP